MQDQDLPTFWAPVDVSRAAFVAANAIVMGNVSIEHGASIWYGAQNVGRS